MTVFNFQLHLANYSNMVVSQCLEAEHIVNHTNIDEVYVAFIASTSMCYNSMFVCHSAKSFEIKVSALIKFKLLN